MIQQKHLDLLLELDTDKNLHTGGALLEHLRGTHDLLHTWGNDQAVCIGGLFHSIYGTQAYQTQSASLEDRQRIRAVIGERAERLAFLFCVSNRGEFFEALDKDDAALWNRVHEETTPVTQGELRDLIEMDGQLRGVHAEVVVHERGARRIRSQSRTYQRPHHAARACCRQGRHRHEAPQQFVPRSLTERYGVRRTLLKQPHVVAGPSSRHEAARSTATVQGAEQDTGQVTEHETPQVPHK